MDTSLLQKNRLGAELSAYLQQHAQQDVFWQPWDAATLAAARQLQRPLLLSIGYSACHWCHVMSREAFSDPDIVALMNLHFVNVKIDREERPDLDLIYQTAYQAMRGRGGGWPLTVFVDPNDLLPFFIGTYFPILPHPQLPGFRQLLLALVELMEDNPQQIKEEKQIVARRIGDSMELVARDVGSDNDIASCHKNAAAILERISDHEFGGFGRAPKFPMAPQLEYSLLGGDAGLREHALESLRLYTGSGLYDHVGGGFFRYCVDGSWQLPHFEKMLYDNATLLRLYALAAQSEAKADGVWRHAAKGIVDWLVREMRTAEGGFISALDADDEQGEEGGGYLWTKEQLQSTLGDEYADFAVAFGLDGSPHLNGKWHLFPVDGHNFDSYCNYASCLEKLRLVRTNMAKHAADDKLLTQFNGLAIAALALASKVFAEPEWEQHARCAFACIETRHLAPDGTLLHMSVSGRGGGSAFAGDYAAMIIAALDLLQCSWRPQLLLFAKEMANKLLEGFADLNRGGFYLNDGSENLLHRPRQFNDDAVPSANALAATALHRLGALLVESRYLDAAAAAVQAAKPWLQQEPVSCCGMLQVAAAMDRPGILLCCPDNIDSTPWVQASFARADLYVVPPDAAELLPQLAACAQVAKAMPTALVCTGQTCLPPVHTVPELEEVLSQCAPR